MFSYALVDCNNFYVSCERAFNPHLNRYPVIVLSNNDGCIIARSNEVKALGIPMGEPYFKIKELVKSHNIKVFSSNFELYGDMSNRVMEALRSFSIELEIYSIDEAFLKLDTNISSLKILKEIARSILLWTGIPVSIGVAKTKTLAKLANKFAKKHLKGSIADFRQGHFFDEYLKHIPLKDIWGISRGISLRLQKVGIHNSYALKHAAPKYIRNLVGVMGERLVLELNGIPCFSLEQTPFPKSIMTSRSFRNGLKDLDLLEEAIAHFASIAAKKLRGSKARSEALCVFLHTPHFKKEIPQYHASKVRYLPFPTSDTSILISSAKNTLKSIYKEGFSYYRAGIILLNLSHKEDEQMCLFHERTHDKSDRLMSTIDSINKRYGKGSLSFAAEGTRRPWTLWQMKRSRRYTTRWTELPLVHAR